MPRNCLALLLICMLAAVVATDAVTALGQPKSTGPAKRARPPKWDDRTKGAFFEDAEKALDGPRPQYGSGGSGTNPTVGPTPGPSDDPPAGGVFAWSKIISPDTLEDEIKTLQKLLTTVVTTPQTYAAGAYQQGNLHFSTLATLFGIIAEYDTDVRWKKQAIGAREIFAQAGFGSRVGSIQAYNQAKNAKQSLDELVQGSPPKLPAGELKVQFAKTVAYRPPLMKRMDIAHKERLLQWTASANEFRGKGDAVLREAELVAAFAEVIARDGYEYADDSEYVKYCQQLKTHALAVVDAVKQKNADGARKAVGEMTKTCAGCHDGYRSQ